MYTSHKWRHRRNDQMTAKWPHHPYHLGVPNVRCGDKKEKKLPSPYGGKVATSTLPSGDPQCSMRGQESEKATEPIWGQSGYIPPAILGVPNALLGDKIQK